MSTADDTDEDLTLPPEAEARLAEAVARTKQRSNERRAWKNLVWAHHWPEQYERCVVINDKHYCRRCITLYPLAIAIALLTGSLGVAIWPERLDVWFVWLLCVPGTIDFALENLGITRYSPRRQIAGTALIGLAYGRGLGLELADRWQWLFWGPVLVFGLSWYLMTLIGSRRRAARAPACDAA